MPVLPNVWAGASRAWRPVLCKHRDAPPPQGDWSAHLAWGNFLLHAGQRVVEALWAVWPSECNRGEPRKKGECPGAEELCEAVGLNVPLLPSKKPKAGKQMLTDIWTPAWHLKGGHCRPGLKTNSP